MDYESTFIFSPQLLADKVEELTVKVVKTIEASQGIVKTIQQLGKKRLAYCINKFSEGSYVYMELTGGAEMVKALESFCKFNDSVIRFLIVKVEKKKVIAKPAKAEMSQETEITQTKSQEMEVQNGPTTEQSALT
jgi:small subunit ribosomal protein S6